MVEEQKGFYAQAHAKILAELPMLKGETLTRRQFHELLSLHPTSPEYKELRNAVNQVLWHLSQRNKKQLITKNGRGYKVVDDELEEIDYLTPSGEKIDLVFPFGIHQYGFLYRKNIMIVAGSKDAGKTAFLLNVVRMNMMEFPILYFSSEMVGEEMKQRLLKDTSLRLEDWCFKPFARGHHFDEVIDPDAVNIIDFLELGGDETDYFKGVAYIRRIYDKLEKGVAIIACQKNRGAELPKGGTGMLEKARLAISLDPNQVVITTCKNWADGITTSPVGLKWNYKLVGGINYVDIQRAL